MQSVHQGGSMAIQEWVWGVQEYGAQIKKFGLQPSAVEHYQALWRTVAPEDQQNELSSI